VATSPRSFTPGQERFGRRFIRAAGRFNIWLYRKTNGRLGSKMPGHAAPLCLFTTTGRRSRLARTVPLIYMRDGARVVVVASIGGMSRHPDWYMNVLASPKVTVDIDGDARAMLARTATAEEKARLWPLLVAKYPPYEKYQQRTTRDIPVVICEPDV
jgi:deazaflavin-dependent oxidoreductase (nitroreductase family)